MKNDELKHKSCFYVNNKLLIVTLIKDLLCVRPCSRIFVLTHSVSPQPCWRLFLFSHFTDGPRGTERLGGLPVRTQLVGGGAQVGARPSAFQHLCPVTVPHCLSDKQLSCPETPFLSAITWQCYVVWGRFRFVLVWFFWGAHDSKISKCVNGPHQFPMISLRSIQKQMENGFA